MPTEGSWILGEGDPWAHLAASDGLMQNINSDLVQTSVT